MASNLSTIGFDFKDNEDFAAKMVDLASRTEVHAPCSEGKYAIWQEPSGIQLWFHVCEDAAEPDAQAIQGLTPFFEGQSTVPVKVTSVVSRPDDNAFEGGFYAWVGPDDSGEGAYPIVFDAVDYALAATREVPFNASVRLAGFARELTAHASAEAYDSAKTEEPKLAAQAFIPMGLFAASAGAGDDPDAAEGDDAAGEPPSPTALLTGLVRAQHLLRNEETGRPFHWLLVESLDASFDIIADPDIVTGEIVVGGVVEVACWFFGRFLD